MSIGDRKDNNNLGLTAHIESKLKKIRTRALGGSFKELMDYINHQGNQLDSIALSLEDLKRSAKNNKALSDQLSNQSNRLDLIDNRLLFIREKKIPVFIMNDLSPAAWYGRGNSPYKVMVCTIPKAGTYLFANLLENIGLVFCKLHLWLSGFSDYRFTSIKEGRENYIKYTVDMTLEDSLKLIHPGQFAVSHLECTFQTKSLLKDFKKIYIYRNIRDVIVSHMRFMCDTGRGKGHEFMSLPSGPEKMIKYMETPILQNIIENIRETLAWMSEPDTLKLSFEQIYGDEGRDEQFYLLERLCSFLEMNCCDDQEKIINKTIGAETLTFSGSRTRWEDFWNEEVEILFEDLGGIDINHKLGYENN